MNKIFKAIENEKIRQNRNIELIASENYVSENILKAQGSILTNKYAEGYPGKRYYGGCEYVDIIEQEAIDLACELFNAKYANVQPHSGSSANMAVYKALLNINDTILGMDLKSGGHLTHGHPLNFSGMDYNIVSYGVDQDGLINYEKILEIAKKTKPKLIIAGGSAYSRKIDFKIFKDIANEVGALLMVDMAHIAGLVCTNLHQSPIDYADVVTSTTHKTLRGPRGGLILTNNLEIAKKINKAVFPGIQGGPLMHVIAAKGIAFQEALEKDFTKYQKQVVLNAKTMAEEFKKRNVRIITGGTDNHLLLVDVKTSYGLTGKIAEEILDEVHITVNKNTIPNDTEKPFITSGIRLGTPAITTRGFKEKEIKKIVDLIDRALKGENIIKEVKDIIWYLFLKDKINQRRNKKVRRH